MFLMMGAANCNLDCDECASCHPARRCLRTFVQWGPALKGKNNQKPLVCKRVGNGACPSIALLHQAHGSSISLLPVIAILPFPSPTLLPFPPPKPNSRGLYLDRTLDAALTLSQLLAAAALP